MASNNEFSKAIENIRQRDCRYAADAYHFIRQGLDYTQKKISKEQPNRSTHHVTGQELAEGIRDFALTQYGPMARLLLEHWGLRQTMDFGHIVFHLIEEKQFGKNESDRLEDFADCFDFDTAFTQPFLPGTQHRTGQL